jgi:hypothetical protein
MRIRHEGHGDDQPLRTLRTLRLAIEDTEITEDHNPLTYSVLSVNSVASIFVNSVA